MPPAAVPGLTYPSQRQLQERHPALLPVGSPGARVRPGGRVRGRHRRRGKR